MDGAHDLGAMQGFGPVVHDEAIFHEEWEARVFALSELAGTAGITAGHFRAAIEAMPPRDYLAASYYERWLFGLERRLEAAGTIEPGELEAAMARVGQAPQPESRDPAFAQRCLDAQRTARPLPAAEAPRFAPGDRVRVRRMRPEGHTRCPRYVRGAVGIVERIHGDDVLADSAARCENAAPEAVYAVRFQCGDLFGEGPEPPFHVCIDLWESYLETPAVTGAA